MQRFEAVQGDEYDAVFGDGHDFMDVDLLDDSCSICERAGLLKKLRVNEKLDDIKFETGDYCLEGFGMQIDHGMCATCKQDTETQFESGLPKMAYILVYTISPPTL